MNEDVNVPASENPSSISDRSSGSSSVIGWSRRANYTRSSRPVSPQYFLAIMNEKILSLSAPDIHSRFADWVPSLGPNNRVSASAAQLRPRRKPCILSKNGAQGRNRTTDTAIFSRMLYQLSYLGVLGNATEADRGGALPFVAGRIKGAFIRLASPPRHYILAGQPAAKIHLGAAAGAERAVRRVARFAAKRAGVIRHGLGPGSIVRPAGAGHSSASRDRWCRPQAPPRRLRQRSGRQ